MYDDLKEFGGDFGIVNTELIISETARTISAFPEYCRKYGIEQCWIEKISHVLNEFLPKEHKITPETNTKNHNKNKCVSYKEGRDR